MTELRRATPFLLFAFVLFLTGCSMLPGPPRAAVETPGALPPQRALEPGPIGPADLDLQRAVWETSGVRDYTWEVAFGCECLLNGPTTVRVVDGEAVEAVNNGMPIEIEDIEGFPLTLDAVFAEAQATLDGGGRVDATWAASGLPRQLNLDRDIRAVDDELGVSVISLTPTR